MSAVLERYAGGGPAARFYRRLRWKHGGFEALARFFPADGLVVDLGCGVGLLAHALLAPTEGGFGRRVLAVDHAPGRVASLRASATGLPLEVREGAMEDVVLPACAGIALVDVLHYLEGEAQDVLIARCARALEPGGVLVLRDPDAGAGPRFFLTRLHERVATTLGLTRATLGRYRSGAAWAALLQAHGFEAEVLPLPRGRVYADRTVVGRMP